MAQKNRLNLNFNLESFQERLDFINAYLLTEEFQTYPPTPTECEKIGDYLLWGKEENGRTAAENNNTELNSYWDSKPVESLETLMESPTFSEQMLRPLDAPKPLIRKETFSREKARQIAPAHLQADFETLWAQIDDLEFRLNTYEFAHGKRKEPPRASLSERITPERRAQIQEEAPHLAPYHYLKLKRQLVELRQQQYDYKDSYTTLILPHTEQFYVPPADPLTFGDEIPVFPLGTIVDEPLIWANNLHTEIFSEVELKHISDFLWTQKDLYSHRRDANFFDFCDVDHLYALCENWGHFKDEENSDSTRIHDLLLTLEAYRAAAHLSPIYEDILDLKLRGKDNLSIKEFINQKYSKSYNTNYISTLYCKKILAEIAAAATAHLEIIENIFFKEEFKQCIDCGNWYLRRPEYFMRRSRAADGYSPRCKACEKVLRDRKK